MFECKSLLSELDEGLFNCGDLFRASTVNRWAMVETIAKQSIAEHMFNVTHMSVIIYHHVIGKTKSPVFEGDTHLDSHFLLLILAAISHDIDEIYTGDIPTPYKKAALKGSKNMDSHMRQQLGGVVRLSEKINQTTLPKDIVKLADVVEAWMWLGRYGKDTAHVKGVVQNLRDRARSLVHDLTNKHNHMFDFEGAVALVIEPQGGVTIDDLLKGSEWEVSYET